jgi:hypothetical protein
MTNWMAATMKMADILADMSSIFMTPINNVSSAELMIMPVMAIETNDIKRFSFLSVTLNVK